MRHSGFPGGAVVESLPASAGDTGSSPGLGRSHKPQSNWAREPQLLSLRVWSLCSAAREVATVKGPRTVMKSGPCLPQLEKALSQKRRPNTARKKERKRHSFNQLLGVLWLTAIAELISKNYPQPKRGTLPDVTPLPAGSPLQKLVSERV